MLANKVSNVSLYTQSVWIKQQKKQVLLWAIVLPKLNKSLAKNSFQSIKHLFGCGIEAMLS